MPRIVCPGCGARYDLAPGAIPPAGRKVRCARCGTVWLARGEAETQPPAWPEPPQRVRPLADEPPSPPPPPAAAQPATPSPAEPASPIPGRSRGRGAAIGWALTLLLLAAAGWVAFAHAETVIAVWPASARIYALFGLAP